MNTVGLSKPSAFAAMKWKGVKKVVDVSSVPRSVVANNDKKGTRNMYGYRPAPTTAFAKIVRRL